MSFSVGAALLQRGANSVTANNNKIKELLLISIPIHYRPEIRFKLQICNNFFTSIGTRDTMREACSYQGYVTHQTAMIK